MMVTLKRAGLPIDFVPWKDFMAGIDEGEVLGSAHTLEDLPMFQPDEEVELQFWMEDHDDEPADIEFNEDTGLPVRTAMFRRVDTSSHPVLRRGGGRQPMRIAAYEPPLAIPGVVGIRSLLR